MRTRIAVAAFLALAFSAGACRGEDVRPAGEVPLGISLWTEGGRTEAVTVHISASARSEHATSGVVTVKLPRGAMLLDGDTTFSVPTRRIAPPRALKLSVPKGSTVELSATVTAGDASNNDLMEARLLLVADEDSVGSGTSELVRTETTIKGHRFRYGGFWLVPMEADEQYSTAEFSRTGVRPEPIEAVAAHCVGCPSAIDTVTFVAVVNRAGKVIQARPLSKGVAPEVTKAAAEALATTRFKPARCGDKAITDWVNVAVRVIRRP